MVVIVTRYALFVTTYSRLQTNILAKFRDTTTTYILFYSTRTLLTRCFMR